jgi:hypothetical protein
MTPRVAPRPGDRAHKLRHRRVPCETIDSDTDSSRFSTYVPRPLFLHRLTAVLHVPSIPKYSQNACRRHR